MGARWATHQQCDLISVIGGADVIAVFDIGPGNRDSLAGNLDASPVQSLNELLAADIDAVIVTHLQWFTVNQLSALFKVAKQFLSRSPFHKILAARGKL